MVGREDDLIGYAATSSQGTIGATELEKRLGYAAGWNYAVWKANPGVLGDRQ